MALGKTIQKGGVGEENGATIVNGIDVASCLLIAECIPGFDFLFLLLFQ